MPEHRNAPARFIIGDTRDVTATLPDGSIDLVLTSPPFLALRSYLPADHPDKHREIGGEPGPAEFLQTLLELAAEWRRVLAPHGSIAVELGDTFAGSGGSGGDYLPGGLRYGQPGFVGSASKARDEDEIRAAAAAAHWRSKNGRRSRALDEQMGVLAPPSRPGPEGRDHVAGWPMDKSLCGIPHLFHLSLAYGMNLLTGEPSPAGRWRIRNVVAWVRPNPPVGALGDKFRPATSYMTIATVARDRYFDLDAVRGNPEDVKDQRHRTTNGPKNGADPSEVLTANYTQRVPSHPNGAPPLDWWEIPTHPYPGSHYATWPPDLCVRPIKAMVPMKVCTTCGEPSRRIVEANGTGQNTRKSRGSADDPRQVGAVISTDVPEVANRTTLGWSDCGHDSWRNGIVLDPFAGSGTTLAVATGLGRDAIGIDLDERNADLAQQRVGMFLSVERAIDKETDVA